MVPENTKINIINNIKTSIEMENQNLSANDISLLNDFADNKISMEDAMPVSYTHLRAHET